MFKLTDRYITTHFISKSLITIIVFLAIFLLVDIVEHLDYIIDSDIPQSEMYRYFLFAIPWYINLGLPMSLLLGTVFTTGILQKNNELSAIKSAGISIKRISIPLLILGIIFSVSSFYYDNTLVSDYLQKRSEIGIKYNLGTSNKLEKSVINKLKKKNIIRQESTGRILSIRRYIFRNNAAYDISIQEFDNGDLIARIDSPEMHLDSNENKWKLLKYQIRQWRKDSLFYSGEGKDTTLSLSFTPTDLTQSAVKPEEMNYWELKNFVKKLDKYGVKEPKWAVNMHFKSAFACTNFLMILFGLSLSIRRPRSNLAVGIGISIFVIFVYYAAITMGRSFGYNGTLEPFMSVWLPNLIFFITGIFLFQNAKS